MDEDSDHIEEDEWSIYDGGGGLSLVAGAAGDVLEDLNTLRQDIESLDFDSLQNNINSSTPLTDEQIQTLLRVATTDLALLDQPGEGLLVSGVAGPSFRYGRFGLAFLGTIYGAVVPRIDLQNLGFADTDFTDVLGPGQDRSGQLSTDGQSLADTLAGTGSLTQNQAEELVYQAETAGVDTSSSTVSDVLNNIVDASTSGSGGSILDNQSGSQFHGIWVHELSLGYAQPIGDWLSLGVAVKGMHAFTSTSSYALFDGSDLDSAVDDFTKNVESSFNVGVDVGVLLTPREWFAVGVTGKNLTCPSFERSQGTNIVLKPNARAGVAFYPTPWLTLAADMDLFKNKSTILPGYESLLIGGGAEADLGIVAIRAGLSKNLADSSEDILLHAGLAFRFWKFSLQFSGMVTPTFEDIGLESIGKFPQRAGISLSLGFDVEF